MATSIDKITSSEWSMSVESYGEVVENFEDINQCIGLIINTRKGTDPLRPLFGADVWRYLDYPVQDAPALMTAEIVNAISTWERRVDLTNVTYDFSDTQENGKKINFYVNYVRAGTNQRGTSLISFSLVPPTKVETPPVVIPPLEIPTSLTANYVSLGGVLSWTYTDAVGITFQIIRSKNGGTFEDVASVVGTTTWTEPSLDFDALYRYRVRAVKGGRVSEFSNEASIQTLQPILTFSAANPSRLTVTKTGTPAVLQSAAGVTKVYVLDNDAHTISSFLADDNADPALNAGITGSLDLSGLSGLRTVRARNQAFTFVPGTWVRNANVSINVSNSITTAARVTELINSVILANGGTLTDNGVDYTGNPGQNHANRSLNIGTIELDLSDPANGVLFDKVVALGTVGWTVTTVKTLCLKELAVNTLGSSSAVTAFEKSRRLFGLDYVSGQPLDVDLYDTLAQANVGGATGRLAQGYANVNAWLLSDANYNAWPDASDKALRFYAANTGSTNNRSNLRYQAFPTIARPCGQVIDVTGFSAYLAYSFRRRVINAYEGALLVLRRTADNQTRAFYANAAGNLRFTSGDTPSTGGRSVTLGGVTYNEETADITTWAGNNTPRIVWLLDQSGNSYHLSQTTAASQPILDVAKKEAYSSNNLMALIRDIASGTNTLPAFLQGNITGTIICRRDILGAPMGTSFAALSPYTHLGYYFTIRVDGTNVPFNIGSGYKSTAPIISDDVVFALRNQSNNSIYSRNKLSDVGYKTIAFARNPTTGRFYVEGAQDGGNINTTLYNNYPTNLGVALGILGQGRTGTPLSGINIALTEVVYYVEELTQSQVQAVTNFLNA